MCRARGSRALGRHCRRSAYANDAARAPASHLQAVLLQILDVVLRIKPQRFTKRCGKDRRKMTHARPPDPRRLTTATARRQDRTASRQRWQATRTSLQAVSVAPSGRSARGRWRGWGDAALAQQIARPSLCVVSYSQDRPARSIRLRSAFQPRRPTRRPGRTRGDAIPVARRRPVDRSCRTPPPALADFRRHRRLQGTERGFGQAATSGDADS